MRSLRRVGVLFSLLIVGVLGGLMAPLPSEAATSTSKPKLMINGVDIPLTWQGNNCTANNGLAAANDNYFLSASVRGCWTVNGTTWNTSTNKSNNPTNADGTPKAIGGFILGSVSATNRARVIINDFSQTGEDKLKLTGITFKSATNVSTILKSVGSSAISASDDGTRCKGQNDGATTDDCQVGVITLINTFDNPGGQNVGDPNFATSPTFPYKFYMNIGSTFVPFDADLTNPTNTVDNVIGDRIRLIGTVCPTWVSHADNDFGCDVLSTSSPYTRTKDTQPGKDGIGDNRVGIGNFANAADSYLHAVLTSGTLASKNVPLTTPTTSPTIIASCRTNGSENNAQCMPTIRLDYIIWVQGLDTIWEQGSPGGCGGSCNSVEAVTTPPKRAVLWCGDAPEDLEDPRYPESLTGKCSATINSNLNAAKTAAEALGAVEAQTCEGAWCVVIQVDGTPPGFAEDKQFKMVASSSTGLGGLPIGSFTIKLDSFISGVTGEGLYTISNLQPGPADVLTILIDDFGPFSRLDNVVCSGGAICQTLYTGPNSGIKKGWTVTGWAQSGRLLADVHIH